MIWRAAEAHRLPLPGPLSFEDLTMLGSRPLSPVPFLPPMQWKETLKRIRKLPVREEAAEGYPALAG